ncbi:aminotransferase class III-fold pyridoxal phosphate-dependent enzyme [Asanoa sp. NPDC049573]|uniref:aminotransferase class III-fold pyridoxal phosphate-dependent enzyme n=1 Tax=Asanoa sp. NPDC049573 TaxID=3155396 RepID=UPI00343E9B0A
MGSVVDTQRVVRPPGRGYPPDLGIVTGAHGATFDLAAGGSAVDLAGGGWGYGDPLVVAAVAAQLARLPLSTRSFLSRPLADAVRRLAELSPPGLDVCYLCNSGAEALDGAIKLAKGRHPRRRTLVTASRLPHHLPVTQRTVPYGDAGALREALTRDVFALVVEPVLTTAGVVVPPPGYLVAAREACDRSGAVLIADETVTGLGRTGERFAWSGPDVAVFGSTLGGGVLPLGAYVARKRLNDRVYRHRTPVLHASTTGGNPASCAAALATLALLAERDVTGNARRLGAVLAAWLDELGRSFPGVVADPVAAGLLGSVTLPDVGWAAAVQQETLRQGAVVLRQGRMLAIRPPLRIRRPELDRGLAALRTALAKQP